MCLLVSMALILLCADVVLAGPTSPRHLNVVDYGGKPDGKTLCTDAIQKAIDAAEGGGTLQNVIIRNVKARGTSPIGCSITGLPGHPVRNVVLDNLDPGFDGGGTLDEAKREISEKEKSHPESTMFGTLPAYGFYCRHVQGLRFVDLRLRTEAPDLRHALVLDDAEDVALNGIEVQFSAGAAPMLRLTNARDVVIRGCSPRSEVATLLRLDGEDTRSITLAHSDLGNVGQIASVAAGVPKGALTQR